jgi:hypothetical protein
MKRCIVEVMCVPADVQVPELIALPREHDRPKSFLQCRRVNIVHHLTSTLSASATHSGVSSKVLPLPTNEKKITTIVPRVPDVRVLGRLRCVQHHPAPYNWEQGRTAHLAVDPIRAANEAIGERIEAAMKGSAGGDVVPLPKRKA